VQGLGRDGRHRGKRRSSDPYHIWIGLGGHAETI